MASGSGVFKSVRWLSVSSIIAISLAHRSVGCLSSNGNQRRGSEGRLSYSGLGRVFIDITARGLGGKSSHGRSWSVRKSSPPLLTARSVVKVGNAERPQRPRTGTLEPGAASVSSALADQVQRVGVGRIEKSSWCRADCNWGRRRPARVERNGRPISATLQACAAVGQSVLMAGLPGGHSPPTASIPAQIIFSQAGDFRITAPATL